MTQVPMEELRGRVLVSRERVKFAAADPYGHLSSGAYVDLIMSHRVEVLADLVGFSIMRSAGSGVAFPARSIEVSYLRPAFVGDELEVGSWVEKIGKSSFEVRAIVCGADDRAARAAARIHFVTVDGRNGRSVPVPESLPGDTRADRLREMPTAADYQVTITGLPDGWSAGPVRSAGSATER